MKTFSGIGAAAAAGGAGGAADSGPGALDCSAAMTGNATNIKSTHSNAILESLFTRIASLITVAGGTASLATNADA
jgi:hypothetical protein